jgi:hypothetical protein
MPAGEHVIHAWTWKKGVTDLMFDRWIQLSFWNEYSSVESIEIPDLLEGIEELEEKSNN